MRPQVARYAAATATAAVAATATAMAAATAAGAKRGDSAVGMANGGSVRAADAPMLPMAMPLPLPMAPSAGHRAGRSGGRWCATGEGNENECVRDEFLRFL